MFNKKKRPDLQGDEVMELCPRCGAALPEGSQACLACQVAEAGSEDGVIDIPALPEETAAAAPLLVTPPPGALSERLERLLRTPRRRRATRTALSLALVALVALVSVFAWSAFVHSAWGARLGGMNEIVFVGASANPLINQQTSFAVTCITTVTTQGGGTNNSSDPTNCANQRTSVFPSGQSATLNASNKGGLYVARPDGTGLRRLTNVPDGSYFSPVWSPDGSRIAAFVIYPTPGTLAYLVIMNADGSHAHIIPAVSLILGAFYQGLSEVGSPLGRLISWAPDSSQLAVPQGDGQFVLIHADGTHLRQLEGSQPTWSPDGRYLAYYRARSGSSDEALIEIMNTQSGQKRDLNTLNEVSGDALAWSPDGRWLAYTMVYLANTTEPISALMLTSTDGSDQRVVAQWDNGFIEEIAWSPDALRLAAVVGNVALASGDSGFSTRQDLWVMNTDQSHLSDLGASDSNMPSWSPDGRHLIFTNQVNVYSASVLIVADTSVSPVREQTLTTRIPFAFAPSWSPLAGL